MRALGFAQQIGDLALGDPRADRPRQHRQPAFERTGQRVEHSRGDVRHSGENEDVAEANSRRARHAIGNQIRPLGHPRHPQPRVGQSAARLVICFEHRTRLGMHHHRDAEPGGDRIDGDVVMGRADPAGGEQIVVARPERVDRLDDRRLDIGHDPHFGEPDALHIEPACELRDILVLRAARENLVTDHHQCRGPDALAHLPGLEPRKRPRKRLYRPP